MAPNAAPPTAPDDLGIDRAFVVQMAQMPFIALAITAFVWAGRQYVHPQFAVAFLIAALILEAVIDGWMFKVPNWLTLPLILSGPMIAGLHHYGVAVGPGFTLGDAEYLGGGVLSSLLGAAFGFLLLFPLFFLLGGMGQGDIKMQTGFGAWVGALYGGNLGLWMILWGVFAGYLAGGVIAVGMIVLRGQFGENVRNVGEIWKDFQVLLRQGPKAASARSSQRRSRWHRLPYGIPLCIGFVTVLVFRSALQASGWF